jgi:hypothetical protein
MILVGTIKMVTQASAQATLIIPTCLGGSTSIPLEGPSPMHCWGCYALLFGLLAVGALLLNDLQNSRLRKRSALS